MFLNIDQIKGQISAQITILSRDPTDYEDFVKLGEMLKESTEEIEQVLNSKNKDELTVLLEVLKYQIGRIEKILEDKDYRDRVHKRGKYAAKNNAGANKKL